ncbi:MULTISPECIES: DUF488 domain-containing protein [Methanobacterium]|uniref:Uroporphyrin-III methyltransferase n=1 Tax=Methanobacterium bryantii TaxID=2161 RepID=A0A2A2H5Z0_METBR|nr:MULTISPECIES: DUF488 family protein [Methanobacterium]OEC88725.1 hypothetical protein A9507_03320 [Methanobacterium sp. A39]PAV04734.1 hypothetical protein ASJ80_10485 [Methanobacterium bryantii]
MQAYESSSEEDDEFRILVDRIWPRRVSKEKANLDTWMKEIAPSNDLRKWFAHDPKKWKEFENKYKDELKDKGELINGIKGIERDKGKVTLIYSAKDKEHNNAVVLEHTLRKL